MEGLVDGSHRPLSSPQQMPAQVEAAVLEARRKHPSWGPRRIAVEVSRSGEGLAVTESSVYRCLRRAGVGGAGWAAAPQTGVEAVGTGPAERVVADGHRGRVLDRRRHPGEGVDRDR